VPMKIGTLNHCFRSIYYSGGGLDLELLCSQIDISNGLALIRYLAEFYKQIFLCTTAEE
jgi:hypothetical protein